MAQIVAQAGARARCAGVSGIMLALDDCRDVKREVKGEA